MSDNESPLGFEDDPELLRIAKALSDGQPVDWGTDADLVEEDSEKVRLLRRLRFLQEVAAAHRQVQEGTGEGSDR